MNIGIDLGTTNSLIAVWKDGESKLIPNGLGEVLTPSVVGIDDDGSVIIGAAAKERLLTHPHFTESNFKRYMGSKKQFKLGKKYYHPEELSALVLKQLKNDAEAVLGEEVDNVVISVPAYFNDKQRSATKTAGALAGLTVDRIINEPTAAGLAYGLHETNKETTFLVFDLGGGTFDVSIVEIFNGIIEIRASTGNNHLGGEDFTQLIIAEFIKQHPTLTKLWEKDKLEQLKPLLRKKANDVKFEIGKSGKATFEISYKDETFSSLITAEQFATFSEALLQKIKLPIQRALSDAKLDPSDIDNILLVGGATRMPIIRKLTAKLFGKLPLSNINPDEAVALGAAVQAGLKMRDKALNEIVVTDVCPYTLGTAVLPGDGTSNTGRLKYLPIIERNTVIPVSKVVSLQNARDYQSKLKIDVYQGESYELSENIHLGKLEFEIPPKREGEVQVDLRYTYDINGLLEVEVTILNTEETHKLVLQGGYTELTKDELEKKLKALSKLKIHPRENAANRLLLARAERLYMETTGEIREYIGNMINQFERVLNTQDPIYVAKAQEAMKAELQQIEAELRIV